MLTALALLAAQAASTLHYVLVPHHLCAEHGVLEDGGASARKPASHAERQTVAVSNADSDQEAHEACPLATRSEPAVLLDGPASLALEPWSTPSCGLSPPTRPLTAGAFVLALAPKTSPPSA